MSKIELGVPKSYKDQDGCYNCKHCFVKWDYDEDNEYYCTIDGVQRPLCGSVGMKEHVHTTLEYKEVIEEDNRFAKFHYGSGITDTYEEYESCYDVDKWSLLKWRSRRKFDKLWEQWSKLRKVKKQGTCGCWEERN